jgi:DNA-binding NtrC family response regulator
LERRADEEKAIAGAVFTSGQINRQNSLEEALKAVKSGWPSTDGWRWALILLDLRFDSTPAAEGDEIFGFKVLKELVKTFPDREAQPGNSEVPIIMLSGELEEIVEPGSNEYGASAYAAKELSRERFDELLEEHGLIEDIYGDLRGKSHALLKLLRDARRVARMRAGNALILGPQGSGKTSLARYIHKKSGRTGALVEHVSMRTALGLEYAQMFGHWAGAFTDAKESRAGKAELAHKGTLLLDEVHNMDPMSQEELLQFGRLENGKRTVRRQGSFVRRDRSVRGDVDEKTGVITVDVLVLAATNEPLDNPDWRSERGFSEPLYTRLALEYVPGPLRLPSLAERQEDIPFLFSEFLDQATKEIGGRTNKDGKKSIDPAVLTRLKAFPWLGNVAQLAGVAKGVALKSKDFADVLDRHLTLPAQPPPVIPELIPEPIIVAPPTLSTSSTHSLKDVVNAIRNAQLPRSHDELSGSLAALQDAYGQLIMDLIEVALDETKPVASTAEKNRPYVPALKLLYGYRMDAYQANGKLLQLAKLFWKDNPPAEGSALAHAILRAIRNRNPKGSGKLVEPST